MKKKGFSLIELLAVIVILAVIALITIPVVSNLIKNSKKEAFRISVQNVSDNVYFHYAKDWLVEGMNEDKVFDFDTNQNVNLLTVNGKLPSGGTLTITPQGKISINVNDGVYCAVKSTSEDKVVIGDYDDGICNIPDYFGDACLYPLGYSWEYDYVSTGTDKSQKLNIPCKGIYKLEVWGAQGGNATSANSYVGGYGGYSTGEIELLKTNSLYIFVGNQGGSNLSGSHVGNTGYNGGGYGSYGGNAPVGGGGGATHIALDVKYNELKDYINDKDSIIIVAGGGGGATADWSGSSWSGNGGHGGGIQGTCGNCNNNTCHYYGCGGSQIAVGQRVAVSATNSYSNNTVAASFGFGQNYTEVKTSNYYSGGGGGYYGGASGLFAGAGGGSGYIANNNLKNKYMYCYNCTTSPSTNESTYTKSEGTNSCTNENPQKDCAKQGNGYARITLIEIK